MKKREEIEALRAALIKAKDEAQRFADIEDGGTCNMDTPVMFLHKWKNAEIEEAFRNTGLRLYAEKNGRILVFDACAGQGYRNTAMAEAFRDSLRASGYTAYVD